MIIQCLCCTEIVNDYCLKLKLHNNIKNKYINEIENIVWVDWANLDRISEENKVLSAAHSHEFYKVNKNLMSHLEKKFIVKIGFRTSDLNIH